MPADEAVEQAVESSIEGVLARALSNFKGTYFFEKKVSDGNYGSDTHGIHVQFDFSPDATDEEFLAAAREAAAQAKAVVFAQAGIEAHWDGDVLREVITDNFGGVTQEQQNVAVQKPAGVGPNPPHDNSAVNALPKGSDERKRKQRENSDWAKQRYQTHPREFWDNRQKKANEGWGGPDFTHKDSRVGFWSD